MLSLLHWSVCLETRVWGYAAPGIPYNDIGVGISLDLLFFQLYARSSWDKEEMGPHSRFSGT